MCNLTFNHSAIQWYNIASHVFSSFFLLDIDECARQSHDCGPTFDCVNTQGSFRCNPKPLCPVGFNRDAQGDCVGKKNYFFTEFTLSNNMSGMFSFPQSSVQLTTHPSAILKCATIARKICLRCRQCLP